MLAEAYHTKFFAGHEFSPKEDTYLSLLISNHSMIYAISTNEYSEVFELGHLEFTNQPNTEIKDNAFFFLQNFSLHQKKFTKVNIAILNIDFSILPEAYHLDRELKSYLSFNGGKQELKNAFSHQVKDFKFAFTLDQDLLIFLEKSFSNASIRHAGAVNLYLFFNHPSLVHCDLFLVVGDSMIEIMLKKNDHLLFYNVYQYSTSEDVLYYVLFAMEQFELNPLHTKLSISAQLPVTNDLIKNISKYVKQVSYATVNFPVKIHKEISKLPQHYYFTLLNQHLCEL